MLGECMEVFQKLWNENKDSLILDSYIPADGTYILVDEDGNMGEPFDIRLDKKTREINRDYKDFPTLCFYDYHSQLVSMNKPQDSKKVIHSNNYFSFFVKKDSVVTGKLTEEVIDGYYEILANPERKYTKSKEASELYRAFEEREGSVNLECLERNKTWIKEHIFQLDSVVDMTKKEYLKIFFLTDTERLLKEDNRYLLPNIYNSNDYNVEIDGVIYGLPNNNLGMNAKKPYLSIKTRKCAAPYLLDTDDVMMQKRLFDYFMNFAASGKNNIYVDTDRKRFIACRNDETPKGSISGFYFRLKKGKELEIHNQDVVPFYSNKLEKRFEFKNVMNYEFKRDDYNREYYVYKRRDEIEKLVDAIFFSKYLIHNYFTQVEDLNITNENLKQSLLMARESLFDWFHKGIDRGVAKVLDKVSMNMVKASLQDGYREKAIRQLNLKYSLKEYLCEGGEDMGSIVSELRSSLLEKVLSKETKDLRDDREYYYAIGQLADYLFSLSNAGKKKYSLINPFVNAKTNTVLKERLNQYILKYDHAIEYRDRRVNNLIGMIKGYLPEGPVDQEMVIMGFSCNNVVYYKEEK